jgi:hypothetical protein
MVGNLNNNPPLNELSTNENAPLALDKWVEKGCFFIMGTNFLFFQLEKRT